MNKELALAMNYKDAPKELQVAAEAHYKDLEKEYKLNADLKKLRADLELARIAVQKSEASYSIELAKWEPKVK